MKNNVYKNIDELINYLNNKIGWILGKRQKNNNNPTNKSNLFFIFIIIIFLLIIWSTTCIDYISEGLIGIIIKNGDTISYYKGNSIVFMRNFPFETIAIIEDPSKNKHQLSKLNNQSEVLPIFSQDLKPYKTDIIFSYSLTNPLIAYAKLYQDTVNLDNYVSYIIRANVRYALSQKSSIDIKSLNLDIFSNQIIKNINIILAINGIKLTTLKLLYIVNNEFIANNDKKTYKQTILTSLLNEANLYVKTNHENTLNYINGYNSFYNDYVINKNQAIINMYTSILKSDSEDNSDFKYLNMSLEDLKLLINNDSNKEKNSNSTNGLRIVNRNPERGF